MWLAGRNVQSKAVAALTWRRCITNNLAPSAHRVLPCLRSLPEGRIRGDKLQLSPRADQKRRGERGGVCTRTGQVVSVDDIRQLHKLQRKRESGELDESEAAVLKSLSQSLQVRLSCSVGLEPSPDP